MKHPLILFVALLCTGCAYYPSPQALKVIESRDYEVKNCQLMGQVYGEAKPFLFMAVGLEMAKDQAKERAAKMYATDVYWTELNTRGAPFAVGRAYRCATSARHAATKQDA